MRDGAPPPLAVRSLYLQVLQFEDQLLDGLRRDLHDSLRIIRQALAERGEDGGQRLGEPPGPRHLDADADRLLVEPQLERGRLDAGQQQRHDPVTSSLTPPLDLKRFLYLLAHPGRVDRVRTQHREEAARAFDGPLDFRLKLRAAGQRARVNPSLNAEALKRLPQSFDEGVIFGAV